jgi:hypothetical protein
MNDHICEYCLIDTDESVVCWSDGHGNYYYHQSCADARAEKFRAFLDNPENFKTKDQRMQDLQDQIDALMEHMCPMCLQSWHAENFVAQQGKETDGL